MDGRFLEFARKVLDEHFGGVKVRMAAALGEGKSSGTMWRQIEESDTLGVESLLRLAQAVNESPAHVLELAGKADISALLESVYGKAPTLTPIDRELIKLSPESKKALLAAARAIAGEAPEQQGRGHPRRGRKSA